MGLIKNSYKSEKLNIDITPAYAMVGKIEIENDTEIKIHKTREDLEKYEPLETINITCPIDRNSSVYEQIYLEAKKGLFKEWQHDILEQEVEIMEKFKKISKYINLNNISSIEELITV